MVPRNSGLQGSRLENSNLALSFGTWNTRFLFKSGAAGIFLDEIEIYRLGIVALQKIRNKKYDQNN